MTSVLPIDIENENGVGFERYLDCLSKFVPEFSAEPEHLRRPFAWQVSFSRVGGLTCCRVAGSHGYSMTIRNISETLHISQPEIGSVTISSRNGTARTFPGSLCSHLADDSRAISGTGCYARVVLRFERPDLLQALASFDDSLSLRDLAPLMQHHLTETDSQSFYHSVQAVTAAMLNDRRRRPSRVAMSLLSEALLFTVIEKLAFEKMQGPADFTSRHVARAADYMHANMHRPLSIADVGAAAGVSVRTLQAAFRTRYGTTPAGYLRRIRLEAARLELSADDNTLPVREVALKWGFTHMGRFAEACRKAYGLLPSQLAKSRKPES